MNHRPLICKLGPLILILASGCGRTVPQTYAGTVTDKASPNAPQTETTHADSPSITATKPGFTGLASNDQAKPILPNRTKRILILTYHDIIPIRTKSSVWFDCTAAEFASQMKTLRSNGCHFVSLQQVYNYLTEDGPLPSLPVAITFADGYEGYVRYAAPILAQERIPSCQFVHTGFVGSQINRPKMTWDQMETLAKNPLFTFGSQTVSHPENIGDLAPEAQLKEFVDSKLALKNHLKAEIPFVAYPNGHFSVESEKIAKQAGYLMGMSEVQRLANESPSIFSVNRFVHTKWATGLRELKQK